MQNKKGVSTLIAIVLLVLITACAIVIIWGIIMPLIDRATNHSQEEKTQNNSQEEPQNHLDYPVNILGNQTSENKNAQNSYITKCQDDCKKLEMEYMNVINISFNPSERDWGCYCSYRNGRGGIPIRIW